ncbi:MAG TPA: pilus assembly protein TadG-related protein [Steroidobacteraceae bacterium]|nr:pilus assembly protein TadG-related protein [Steroidobacteraceae bacterium]
MRRPHSGQASVMLLALMASLVTAFAVSFGAGQLVNDKMRLVNAADAAAYSAAQWEARSLNFQSYLNRAIVANEVAIAQLVSLRAWSSYVATLTRNGAALARWIPPLAAPVQSLERGWQAVDSSLQAVAPGLEGGISSWNVDVLANAEGLAHQQALIVAADLAAEVARANEPRARINDATRLLQLRNAAAWQNQFTDRYRRGGGDLRRFVELLMKSRDGFTRSRSGSISVPLVRVARRGGTDLLAEHSWRGLDTMSVHVDLLVDSVEVPIGWGSAEARSRTVNERGQHGGSLSSNPAASRRALRSLRPSNLYRGVPEIRDVITPSRQDDRRLRYAVALQIPQPDILAPDRLLMPGGVLGPDGLSRSLGVTLAGGGVHALGAAEVYFRRPTARADGRREFPSLFSPYWQTRLVAVTAAERQLTAPGRGLTVDPYVLAP